jgi:hypothetical protein
VNNAISRGKRLRAVEEHEQHQAQETHKPVEQGAEVIAHRGEDGIDRIAFAVGNIIAINAGPD